MCKLHCTLCGAVPVTNWYSGTLAVLTVLALVFRLLRPGASFIHAWGCRQTLSWSIELFGFLVLIRAVEITWKWAELKMAWKLCCREGRLDLHRAPVLSPSGQKWLQVCVQGADSESYVTYEPELVPLCQHVNSQWRTSLKVFSGPPDQATWACK